MAGFTTEILTIDEFLERRKIGRTTLFERIKTGLLVNGVDFIADGNEKKFFWPPREFYQRDQLLANMCGNQKNNLNVVLTDGNTKDVHTPPPAIMFDGPAGVVNEKLSRARPRKEIQPPCRRPRSPLNIS